MTERTFTANGIEWKKHDRLDAICRPHPCDKTGDALLLAAWNEPSVVHFVEYKDESTSIIGFESLDSAADICEALRALVGPQPWEVAT